jgi:hypothetical protein
MKVCFHVRGNSSGLLGVRDELQQLRCCGCEGSAAADPLQPMQFLSEIGCKIPILIPARVFNVKYEGYLQRLPVGLAAAQRAQQSGR